MTDIDADDACKPYSNGTATFGDRQAGAGAAQGMSRGDLAEPRANRLSMLSGLLNVSLPWLLTGEGDGLGAPENAVTVPDDAAAILTELRRTQSDLTGLGGRVGCLEKRMRQTWKN